MLQIFFSPFPSYCALKQSFFLILENMNHSCNHFVHDNEFTLLLVWLPSGFLFHCELTDISRHNVNNAEITAKGIVPYKYCILSLIQPFICLAQVSSCFVFTFPFVYNLCISRTIQFVHLRTNLINEPQQGVVFWKPDRKEKTIFYCA